MDMNFMGIVDDRTDAEIHANSKNARKEFHMNIAARKKRVNGYYQVIGIEDRVSEFRITKSMGGHNLHITDKEGGYYAGSFESYVIALEYVFDHIIENRDCHVHCPADLKPS